MKKKYASQKLLVVTKFMVLFLIIGTSVNYAQTLNSNATLEVENNQDSKKASNVGTSFLLELTNTSSKSATFIISVVNVSDEKKTASKNISINGLKLENELRDKSYRAFNKNQNQTEDNGLAKRNGQANKSLSHSITLDKNEVFKFYVNQSVPEGAIEGSKNTSKVVVTSKDFPNLNVTKILQTEFTNCCAQ